MIDIHPPEHTPHTWRDFFIHIATIVLGLVIAIGLEQSVVWIHERHVRHELEANMRAEAQRNIDILTVHLDVNIPSLLWDRAALTAVRNSVPKAGFIDVTLPPALPHPGNARMIAPERNVWPAAEAAGTAVLLPNDLAQTYAQLDHQFIEDDREVEHIREASALLTRFELATGSKVSPGRTLQLTLAQRDQLVLAMSTNAQTLYDLLHRDNVFMLNCQAVAQGIHETNAIFNFFASHDPMRIDRYR